jgi:hypothetical protein
MADAEIDAERKRPWVWPWVILMVATIATVVIWKAAIDDRPDRDVAVDDTFTGTAGAVRNPVDEYLEFAGITDETGELPRMGLDHEYTAEGLRKLGAALERLVDDRRDGDARANLERFRQAADSIQRDPSSLRHADEVRGAFMRAVEIIEALDSAPSGIQVRSAARSIDVDRALLDQRESVKNFFRESALAIRAASRRQERE